MKASPATAADLLRASPLDAVDARILLAHALGWSRTQLITRADAPLEAAAAERYLALEARRVAGEPVAQLVGSREFFGLAFEVTPDVLIPRPETELLVEAALDGARPGGAVTFLESDWYAALDPAARFHAIVSNPPYIARHDPHLDAGDLRFEPRGALTDEADGLAAIRRIVAGAGAFLLPRGELWIEHGYDQAEAVRELLSQAGFEEVASLADLASIERTTGGRLPG